MARRTQNPIAYAKDKNVSLVKLLEALYELNFRTPEKTVNGEPYFLLAQLDKAAVQARFGRNAEIHGIPPATHIGGARRPAIIGTPK